MMTFQKVKDHFLGPGQVWKVRIAFVIWKMVFQVMPKFP